MPIRVACQCGKAFAAPDHFAGKRVKCPSCGQPIAIPAAGQSPQRQRPQQPQQPQQPAGGLGGLFDEAGFEQAAAGSVPCPACGGFIPPNAVVCMQCGFNRAQGTQHTAHVAARSADGYAGSADATLARAARELKESPIDEDSGNFDSRAQAYLMTFVLLGVAAFVTLGTVVFFTYVNKQFVNRETNQGELQPLEPMPDWGTNALVWTTLAVMSGGSVTAFVGWLMITIGAFKNEDSPIHGILCLLPFTNIYSAVYGCMHWDRYSTWVICWVGGQFCAIGSLFIRPIVQSSAPTMVILMIMAFLLLQVAGVFLFAAGWIWAAVLGFLDEIYHGAIAIIYPIYGLFYCATRWSTNRGPVLAWFGGLGCFIVAWVVIPIVATMVILADAPPQQRRMAPRLVPSGFESFQAGENETDEQKEARRKAMVRLGVRVGAFFGRPTVLFLISFGLIYGSVALFNLIMKDTKLPRPTTGSALWIAFGANLAYFLVASCVTFSTSYKGLSALRSVGAIYIVLLIVFLPACYFIVADLFKVLMRLKQTRVAMILGGIFWGIVLPLDLILTVITASIVSGIGID